jgi:hypothetical protein
VQLSCLRRRNVAIAVPFVLAATVFAPAGLSAAVPSWQEDAATTVARLEAEGYRVVVNRLGMGTAPLYDCGVWAVRHTPGESVVHVDVACDRDTRDATRYPVRDIPYNPQ